LVAGNTYTVTSTGGTGPTNTSGTPQPAGQSTSGTVMAPPTTSGPPTFVSSFSSASDPPNGAIILNYNEPVTCSSVTSADYTVQSPSGTADAPSTAECTSTSSGPPTESSQVVLFGFATSLVAGNTYTVTSTGGTGPTNSSGTPQPAGQSTSGTVAS
ncbi:MAG: hypothetical protein ACYDB3_11855, partial [Acidimicrobiales bacterium]